MKHHSLNLEGGGLVNTSFINIFANNFIITGEARKFFLARKFGVGIAMVVTIIFSFVFPRY